MSTDAQSRGQTRITPSTSPEEIQKHLEERIEQLGDLSGCQFDRCGSGNFGDVYKGRLPNGTEVAMKCLKSEASSVLAQQIKECARELYVWSKCDHENVLKLIGLGEYHGLLAMVSPWAGNNNLFQLIRNETSAQSMSFAQRYRICVKIVDAVRYLHEQGIVHGDLKADNIMMPTNEDPLLVDFGLSIIREHSLHMGSKTINFAMRWAPPEIEINKRLTQAMDVYSLGMTIYEVITGCYPFPNIPANEVRGKVGAGELPSQSAARFPDDSDQANRLWEILTTKCWVDASERATAQDLLDMMNENTPT